MSKIFPNIGHLPLLQGYLPASCFGAVAAASTLPSFASRFMANLEYGVTEIREARLDAVDGLADIVEGRLFSAAKPGLRKFTKKTVNAVAPEMVSAISIHSLTEDALKFFKKGDFPRVGRLDFHQRETLHYIFTSLSWPGRLRRAVAIQYLSLLGNTEISSALLPALKSLDVLKKPHKEYEIVRWLMGHNPGELSRMALLLENLNGSMASAQKLALLEKLYLSGESWISDAGIAVESLHKYLETRGWSKEDIAGLIAHMAMKMGAAGPESSFYQISLQIESVIDAILDVDMDVEPAVQKRVVISALDPDLFEDDTLGALKKALKKIGPYAGVRIDEEAALRIVTEVQEGREVRMTERFSKDLDFDIFEYSEIASPTGAVAQKYAAKYMRMKGLLNALGITVLKRFPNAEVANEIIKNRTSDDPEDKRPVAVLLMAKSDHNDAFMKYCRGNLEDLVKRYRVIYYEVDSSEAFTRKFVEASSLSPAMVIVGAHGNPKAMLMGNPSLTRKILMGRKSYFGISDAKLLSPAAAALAGAYLLLDSCSTAEGGESARNLANAFADALPQTTIQAMAKSGGVFRQRYDEESGLVDPEISVRSYLINRSQGRYEEVLS